MSKREGAATDDDGSGNGVTESATTSHQPQIQGPRAGEDHIELLRIQAPKLAEHSAQNTAVVIEHRIITVLE